MEYTIIVHPVSVIVNHWAHLAFRKPAWDWPSIVPVRAGLDGSQTLTSTCGGTLQVCQDTLELTYMPSKFIVNKLVPAIVACASLCTVKINIANRDACVGSQKFVVKLSDFNHPISFLNDLLWINRPAQEATIFQNQTGQILYPHGCIRTSTVYLNHVPFAKAPRSMLSVNIFLDGGDTGPHDQFFAQRTCDLWESAVDGNDANALILYYHIGYGDSMEAQILSQSVRVLLALAKVFRQLNGATAIPMRNAMHIDLYTLLSFGIGTQEQNLLRQLIMSDPIPRPFPIALRKAIDFQLYQLGTHMTADNIVVHNGPPECKNVIGRWPRQGDQVKFIINYNMIVPDALCNCTDKSTCIADKLRRRLQSFCHVYERGEEAVLETFDAEIGCSPVIDK